MPPKAAAVTNDDHIKLLLALYKQKTQSDWKPDWQLIADEINVPSAGAAQKRYSRLIASLAKDASASAGAHGPGDDCDPGAAPKAKQAKKRKTAGDADGDAGKGGKGKGKAKKQKVEPGDDSDLDAPAVDDEEA